jgi:hypothetical protein
VRLLLMLITTSLAPFSGTLLMPLVARSGLTPVKSDNVRASQARGSAHGSLPRG